jgi:hypothetical protein
MSEIWSDTLTLPYPGSRATLAWLFAVALAGFNFTLCR